MSSPAPNQQQDLGQILAAGKGSSRFGGKYLWLALIAMAILAGLGYAYLRGGKNAKAPSYQTETVARGNLVVNVSATGNLQPTNQVDVGSELSGIVQEVYVDDNSKVKKGQVLARLDVSKLNDQIAKSRAALAAAGAGVKQAEATLAESRANLLRFQEVARLSGGKVPSKAEMETAEATQARSVANLTGAHADVTQAQATLRSDETNLSKASIRSPINGVVLSRKIEPGQTVAASLSAPVLFTLAEDLSKMELHVNVDEADVGQVQQGQDAVFNVDAYPSRKYPAKISRVGFGSQTTEGVVSYLTLLTVNNDDLSLRPGMTATAEITTATRDDVLQIPNAALRFTPPTDNADSAKSGNGIVGMLVPRFPRGSSKRGTGAKNDKPGSRQVWVLKDGQAVPVKIQTGLTNGRYTEVLGGDLQAGAKVITDTLSPAK